MTTGTTEIRLEGATNFRDIGGHLTNDGRRIKRTRIFRSGELSRLTDADLNILSSLGVGFVADLRSLKEVGVHRSRWPERLETIRHQADITMDLRLDGRPFIDWIKEAVTPEEVVSLVGKSFHVLPDLCGPALRQIAEQLVRGNQPVLFHCTNGRDRTGVLSAMLLHLLGAPRETIVIDFMTTNERIDVELVVENSIASFRNALGMDLDRKIVERVTLVHPSYIGELFRGLEVQYGSPETYLDVFGIDHSMRLKLRERLLEPV